MALALRSGLVDAIARSWRTLASAGASFTGEKRIAIAEVARQAMNGTATNSEQLDEVTAELVRMVANDAHSITEGHVQRWQDLGLDPMAYVEIVGVVSRLASVDTTMRGLGAPELDLPSAVPGDPNREFASDAKKRSAFVPMVGAAGAVEALTAVPSEAAAQRDIHMLYLSYEQMGDLDITLDLHRTQMELVATRTSLINECDY